MGNKLNTAITQGNYSVYNYKSENPLNGQPVFQQDGVKIFKLDPEYKPETVTHAIPFHRRKIERSEKKVKKLVPTAESVGVNSQSGGMSVDVLKVREQQEKINQQMSTKFAPMLDANDGYVVLSKQTVTPLRSGSAASKKLYWINESENVEHYFKKQEEKSVDEIEDELIKMAASENQSGPRGYVRQDVVGETIDEYVDDDEDNESDDEMLERDEIIEGYIDTD